MYPVIYPLPFYIRLKLLESEVKPSWDILHTQRNENVVCYLGVEEQHIYIELISPYCFQGWS